MQLIQNVMNSKFILYAIISTNRIHDLFRRLELIIYETHICANVYMLKTSNIKKNIKVYQYTITILRHLKFTKFSRTRNEFVRISMYEHYK